MENFISDIVNSFASFLKENENKIRERSPSNVLVSFLTPTNDYRFHDKINHLTKDYERSFYFEKPDENFSIIGVDEAYTIAETGERRFSANEKKIKELKDSFINNWEILPHKKIPLFLGGMKFTTEHNDEDWKDFGDSTWFIPEILIVSIEDKNYLIFNSFSQNFSAEQAIKRFKTKIEKFEKAEASKENPNSLKVLNCLGNTPKDKKKWKQIVSDGLKRISENHIEKVVVSRKIELSLSAEPDFNKIVTKLKSNYANCYIFIYHHGKSNFFGATPEVLAEFSGNKLKVEVLAGSAPRGNSTEEDGLLEKRLLADKKNLHEHDVVIDHIKNSIINLTENFKLEKHYSIKKLSNIQHIWSTITAVLLPQVSMMNLLKELHPTPAVCGLPKDAAMHLIKKLEGYKRGLYTGIIGWFNLYNEGEFVVALRSALNTSNKLIAFAGNGIVDNSDPEAEYKETELKLKPIMSLFADENKN